MHDVINACNHRLDVKLGDKIHKFKGDTKTPRIVYAYQGDEDSLKAIAMEVTHLPPKRSSLKIIVSKNTLIGVRKVEARLLKIHNLGEWIELFGKEKFYKRFRRTSWENIDKKFPELKAWLFRNVQFDTSLEPPSEFFRILKRHLDRTDLRVPGKQVLDSKGNVKYCLGLIKEFV